MRAAGAALLGLTTLFTPAAAQSMIPPMDLVRLTTCLEQQMGDALSDSTITINERGGGDWRLTLALRGQPTAEQGVQSPPPQQNSLAYIDLAAAASERDLPRDLDMFCNWAMASGDSGLLWYARFEGFPWPRVRSASADCFQRVNNATRVTF